MHFVQNFFREVRNLVIDLRRQPADRGTGIHHQVSQATGLYNVFFLMHKHTDLSSPEHLAQQGIYMENGSGGVMRDLHFVGGRLGAFLGNQQFTMLDCRFEACSVAAIEALWNWGWVYHRIVVQHCGRGMLMHVMGESKEDQKEQRCASNLLVDWVVEDTPVAVEMVNLTSASPGRTNSATLFIDNLHTHNVPHVVVDVDGKTLLEGSTGGAAVIQDWMQGSAFTEQKLSRIRGPLPVKTPRTRELLDVHGRWFTRARPQCE